MPLLKNEPGHGSTTWPPSKGVAAKGGVPGMAEHTFNASVADGVNQLLKGKLATYSAQPSNQPDVPLGTRIARYNEKYKSNKDAIGMSHHGNAGNSSTRGFGVFYWHASAAGKKLAQMLLNEYKREFPDMPIWGTGLFACVPGTWTDFYLVRETYAPFILIEWEFFTNDAARKIMLTAEYRKRCSKVAAKVACDWYGIPFEENKPTIVKPAAPKPKPVAKPVAPKPKEEDEMLKQAIVIGSLNDYAAAEILSVRKGIPIFPRNAIKEEVAKELIVVGGSTKGLKADKVTILSGDDRFETAQNVEKYLKK